VSNVLELEKVVVARGAIEVIRGLSLELREREVLAVMGPNGAGKTSLLEAIVGLIPLKSGTVKISGTAPSRLTPPEMIRLGVTLVPQDRHLFPNFTVEENVKVGGYIHRRKAAEMATRLESVLKLFPNLDRLRHSRASALSGGEQQMAAVARAMMSNPRVLLLDEPSHGLAPKVIEELVSRLTDIVETSGGAVIIAEQNMDVVSSLANRFLFLDASDDPLELSREELTTSAVANAYFGPTR
jgi:branched-chain amino acid transport system ATP-binding protein